MPALSNPKHEAFCQAYVRGEHAGVAAACYRKAFGTDNRMGASRLLQRNDVGQRIAELQAQVSQIEAAATDLAIVKLSITKEKVLEELARMGFANMLDYVRPTEDGDVVVDLSRLDRDRATAIQEVVVDTYVDGKGDGAKVVKRVRFKLADKRSSLETLAKMVGWHIGEPVAEVAPEPAEMVDRPPRETFKQWQERRKRELQATKGKSA